MTHILAVANQKGGVAKTTTVASLGAALAEMGRRVLVVDLDPQACLTFSLGLDPEALEVSVHDVLLGRVSASMAVRETAEGPAILPSTIDLAGCEVVLLTKTGREYVLRSALEDLVATASPAYDDILIDCPPSLGVLTINALTAAHEVLIPMQCETLSYRGVGQLLDTIHDIQRLTNRGLAVLGVLPTIYDGRSTHSRQVLADVSQRYSLVVVSPPIPKSIRFAEAPAAGRSVLSTTKPATGSGTGSGTGSAKAGVRGGAKGAQAYRDVAARIVGERAAREVPVPGQRRGIAQWVGRR